MPRACASRTAPERGLLLALPIPVPKPRGHHDGVDSPENPLARLAVRVVERGKRARVAAVRPSRGTFWPDERPD